MHNRGKIRILLMFMIVMAISACSDRPTAAQIREEGNKYATMSDADQRAQSAEQQRQFAAQEQDKEMAKEQWKLDVRNAVKAVTITMLKIDIVFLGIGLIAVVVSTSIGYVHASIGTGKALAKAADFRAEWVPLDVKTRQYPLLRHVRGDVFYLTNPNDDSILRLDVNQPADRQKVISAGMVQFGGLLAYEAARARTDTGAESIPLIDPSQATMLEGFDVSTYEQVRKLFGTEQEVEHE